jgi:hypothetical protein
MCLGPATQPSHEVVTYHRNLALVLEVVTPARTLAKMGFLELAMGLSITAE